MTAKPVNVEPPGSTSRRAAGTRPGSTASLRAANQRRVIALLQDRSSTPQVSQAEIARTTHLAPATVSNIVRDLAAAGLVETTVGSGRRGTVVRIARSAGLVAGIDIGHRHVRVALGDLAGELLGSERVDLHPEHAYGEALDLIEGALGRLLASVDGTLDEVVSIGLGIPAPVSPAGVVMSSAILPGWVGINAHEVVVRRLGRPLHIDNDANLGALAEHRQGAGRNHPEMVFVKVSSGVGAGLIIHGEVFRGAAGTAGEIGHLTLDEQGPLCRCGSRGCLEAYASTGTAETMIAGHLPHAGIDDIVAAATAGNVAALRIFEDAGLHLGWGLAMLANLINPSAIIIGGDMSRAGDLLLDPVRMGLRRHALPSVAATTEVIAASLGDRASVTGALLFARERTELVPADGIG